LEARTAASSCDDDEIARPCIAEALSVDDERNAGREVRLADDELPPPRELDDD
jgi:hypothetical protein